MTVSANELPGLGTAVEVAAYRICLEALTNVVRHAHATELTLTATADSLTIEVVDDGKITGIWPRQHEVTLRRRRQRNPSMRERAALVGGTLTAADRRVLVNLPL